MITAFLSTPFRDAESALSDSGTIRTVKAKSEGPERAWVATNRWLREYAYHIDVQWCVFASAGAIATAIALLTVSYQAIMTAFVNPVESLRSE